MKYLGQENSTDNINKAKVVVIPIPFEYSTSYGRGTPEPGGFFWYETLEFFKELFSKRNVAGFDVVELCPQMEVIHPNFLLAKFIYKLFGYYYTSEKNSHNKQ